MKNLSNKFLSLVLMTVLMTTLLSFSFSANAAEEEKIKVIIRNDVFSVEDGAAWDGVLVDEWVDIDEDTTIISAILTALDNHGYSQTGAENSYFTEINGLCDTDGGLMGGWMGTLNDWFTTQGFDAYSVTNGTLESGDEICLMYSMAWGADIGSMWDNSDIYLTDISFSGGVLNEEFNPEINDYTLTVPYDTESLVVKPTAYNKNYQTRTQDGD